MLICSHKRVLLATSYYHTVCLELLVWVTVSIPTPKWLHSQFANVCMSPHERLVLVARGGNPPIKNICKSWSRFIMVSIHMLKDYNNTVDNSIPSTSQMSFILLWASRPLVIRTNIVRGLFTVGYSPTPNLKQIFLTAAIVPPAHVLAALLPSE